MKPYQQMHKKSSTINLRRDDFKFSAYKESSDSVFTKNYNIDVI